MDSPQRGPTRRLDFGPSRRQLEFTEEVADPGEPQRGQALEDVPHSILRNLAEQEAQTRADRRERSPRRTEEAPTAPQNEAMLAEEQEVVEVTTDVVIDLNQSQKTQTEAAAEQACFYVASNL